MCLLRKKKWFMSFNIPKVCSVTTMMMMIIDDDDDDDDDDKW
jgi:hypothetical protein